MACFIVSAAEAVVVTAVEKAEKKKEQKEITEGKTSDDKVVIPLSKKLKWLSSMLWGGVILLAFEHIWHGEIVPYFPFLTGAQNPNDAIVMLREMATVGVSMAVLITLVWFIMCKVADAIVNSVGEIPHL